MRVEFQQFDGREKFWFSIDPLVAWIGFDQFVSYPAPYPVTVDWGALSLYIGDLPAGTPGKVPL